MSNDIPLKRFILAAGILVGIVGLGMWGAEDSITYGAVTGLVMVIRETLTGVSIKREAGEE